jgi:hypothetical protein
MKVLALAFNNVNGLPGTDKMATVIVAIDIAEQAMLEGTTFQQERKVRSAQGSLMGFARRSRGAG